MDPLLETILPERRRAESHLPGQVRSRTEATVLEHKLQFHGPLQSLAEPRRFRQFLRQLFHQDWVVYAKPPVGGPEHVLNSRPLYAPRRLSNHRLVAFQNDRVSFRWKDYARGAQQTVSVDEFLRLFLIHVLPKGLVRIRHFGVLANRRRGNMLARCRALLGVDDCATNTEITTQLRCPVCTGPMLVIERMTSSQLHFRSGLILADPQRCSLDSS